MVPIAPLTVSQPKFGLANLWDAQRAHDGVVEFFSSTNVGERGGNMIEHVARSVMNQTSQRAFYAPIVSKTTIQCSANIVACSTRGKFAAAPQVLTPMYGPAVRCKRDR
jgi:hypothetical protein